MKGILVATSTRKEHAKSKCKALKERCTGIEESYGNGGMRKWSNERPYFERILL